MKRVLNEDTHHILLEDRVEQGLVLFGARRRDFFRLARFIVTEGDPFDLKLNRSKHKPLSSKFFNPAHPTFLKDTKIDLPQPNIENVQFLHLPNIYNYEAIESLVVAGSLSKISALWHDVNVDLARTTLSEYWTSIGTPS